MSNIRKDLIDIITFVKELEGLKDNTRTAWTKSGRRESIAEHSWRLSVFAMVLQEYFPDIDFTRVIEMSLIHDFGEVYGGDIPAIVEENRNVKLEREEKALTKLLGILSEKTAGKIMDLWREYNSGDTKESRLVKALDKMETIIQHNQGKNPGDFNYEFNLEYGRKYCTFDPTIKKLREIIDEETKCRTENNN